MRVLGLERKSNMVKNTALMAFLIALNLLFFTMTSACGGGRPTPKPKIKSDPTLSPSASSDGSCPRDTLKLGACIDLLNLLKLKIADPPTQPCCSLIDNLLELEVAICLCTTIKANVLGIINLNLPIDLSLVIDACAKKVPKGFQCA